MNDIEMENADTNGWKANTILFDILMMILLALEKTASKVQF